MIKYYYSVFDKMARIYNDPIILTNDDVAKRGFADECSKVESMLNKFPTDYTLFRVGEFDDTVGQFTSYEPIVICRATDFIGKE